MVPALYLQYVNHFLLLSTAAFIYLSLSRYGFIIISVMIKPGLCIQFIKSVFHYDLIFFYHRVIAEYDTQSFFLIKSVIDYCLLPPASGR